MALIRLARLQVWLVLAVLLLAEGQRARAEPFDSSSTFAKRKSPAKKDASVLILGGGVAGVIAARTLFQRGHTNFTIVDARSELGGRMQNKAIGSGSKKSFVELGPNWVQGTQTDDGPENPILNLTKFWGVKTQFNDLFGSLCECYLLKR